MNPAPHTSPAPNPPQRAARRSVAPRQRRRNAETKPFNFIFLTLQYHKPDGDIAPSGIFITAAPAVLTFDGPEYIMSL